MRLYLFSSSFHLNLTVEFCSSQPHIYLCCVQVGSVRVVTNHENPVLKTIFTLIEMNNDKMIHIETNAYGVSVYAECIFNLKAFVC